MEEKRIAVGLSEIAGQLAGRLESDMTVADALCEIAATLQRLGNGDAATPMGAIEALGKRLGEGLNSVAEAINNLASAVESTKIPKK